MGFFSVDEVLFGFVVFVFLICLFFLFGEDWGLLMYLDVDGILCFFFWNMLFFYLGNVKFRWDEVGFLIMIGIFLLISLVDVIICD